MRIRMITRAAGPDFSWQAGSIQDIEVALALALIEGGYAVAVDLAESPVVIEATEAGTTATRRTKRATVTETSEGA